MILRVFITLLLPLCIGTAHPESLTGHPRVVDADDAGVRHRAGSNLGYWRAGSEANMQGRRWQGISVRGGCHRSAASTDSTRTVMMCKGDSRDRYGRLIGVCFFAGGIDLNGGVVHHALAHPVPARKTDLPITFHGRNAPLLPVTGKSLNGGVLRRPQQETPAATVDLISHRRLHTLLLSTDTAMKCRALGKAGFTRETGR